MICPNCGHIIDEEVHRWTEDDLSRAVREDATVTAAGEESTFRENTDATTPKVGEVIGTAEIGPR